MTDAYLMLSLKPGDAHHVIAGLLRDYRCPDHPIAVRRDRDRLRAYWMVEVSGEWLGRRRADILGGADGPDAGRIVAPTIAALFRDERFDARWRLKVAT